MPAQKQHRAGILFRRYSDEMYCTDTAKSLDRLKLKHKEKDCNKKWLYRTEITNEVWRLEDEKICSGNEEIDEKVGKIAMWKEWPRNATCTFR